MSGTKRRSLGLALCLAMLIPAWSTARAKGPHRGYVIQVFALVGPTCPLRRFGHDCPDAFLPDTPLVLERLDGKGGDFQPVQAFRTNPLGYAFLEVERRGFYRISAPAFAPGPGVEPIPFPRLVSRVTFKVPAAHFDSAEGRLTPVVVFFDSGIR